MSRRAIQNVAATLAFAAACFVAGCSEEPGIVTYTAPVDPRPTVLAERQALREARAKAAVPWTMSWTKPDAWAEQRHDAGDRIATLTAGQGDSAMEIAISRFGGGGDVQANLTRWAGQIGMTEPITKDTVKNIITPITTANLGGILVDLKGRQRMLVAWFTDDRTSWFIKTTADDAVIEAHMPAFKALVDSVQFESNQTQDAPEQSPGESETKQGYPPGGGDD